MIRQCLDHNEISPRPVLCLAVEQVSLEGEELLSISRETFRLECRTRYDFPTDEAE